MAEGAIREDGWLRQYFWVVLIIFFISSWLRFDCYQTKHPDQDELFELSSILGKGAGTVFDNKAFYGDHTSFPGEYILYFVPIKMMGWDVNPPSIDVGRMKVTGVKRADFLKLAAVKVVLWAISFWLLYSVCVSRMGGWGTVLAMAMYGFNFQLVYHAFEARPYSVLPVLAVLNLWLSKRNHTFLGWTLHVCAIFFTCVYHAYGPMIAFLPCFFAADKRIFFTVPAALCLWAYYASYSTFGMTPNGVQSVVGLFQYFPKQKFFENLMVNLSGGSLIFYALVPLLACTLVKGWTKNEWWFFSLLVALPILLIFLVDWKTRYCFHPRQFVWVVPFFVVFCGGQVDKIARASGVEWK